MVWVSALKLYYKIEEVRNLRTRASRVENLDPDTYTIDTFKGLWRKYLHFTYTYMLTPGPLSHAVNVRQACRLSSISPEDRSF
jgi:hypothetical protein